MKQLTAKPLSNEALRNFGYYVSEQSGEPLANNEIITYWDKLSEIEMGPVVSTGIVVGHKEDSIISEVERHTKTSELLVSLKGDSLVLLGKGKDDWNAFYIREGEGLALKKGIWHSVPVPANKECKLLVVFTSGTPDNDFEAKKLVDKIKINY